MKKLPLIIFMILFILGLQAQISYKIEYSVTKTIKDFDIKEFDFGKQKFTSVVLVDSSKYIFYNKLNKVQNLLKLVKDNKGDILDLPSSSDSIQNLIFIDTLMEFVILRSFEVGRFSNADVVDGRSENITYSKPIFSNFNLKFKYAKKPFNRIVLTNETKYINKILCNKGQLFTRDKNLMLTFWYNSKIPCYFSVLGKRGFPGLLMEVTDHLLNMEYKLKSYQPNLKIGKKEFDLNELKEKVRDKTTMEY